MRFKSQIQKVKSPFNSIQIIENLFILGDVISYLDHVADKYGSPARLWVGPQLVVLITDAENVDIILKSKDCLNKPCLFHKAIQDALDVDGFFTLKGELNFASIYTDLQQCFSQSLIYKIQFLNKFALFVREKEDKFYSNT